jgi:amino acid transporter
VTTPTNAGITLAARGSPAGSPIPPALFVGLAVASIGGPLALAAIYVPGAADMRSAGLFTLLGSALYALPLLVWLRYSEEIVSAGGLAAFVEAGVGRRAALAQAAIWMVSYFLYLPYTVTDIVYEMLADVFPGITPWRWLIELLLPIAIVGLVLLGTMPVLRVLLVSAVVQLALMLVLGFVMLRKVGVPDSSFTHVGSTRELFRGSANIALLFVCGSLPLFLGAEVVGGGRTVRRSLSVAGAVTAAYLVFAVFPLAAVEPALVHDDFPGVAIANAYSGRTLAIVIGVGAIASVAGVIVAEYLALSRLLFAITGVQVRKLLLWIGVPFIAADALSVVDPKEFDHSVLRVSLVALYLSQLIVFAVFPVYRGRRGRLTPVDILLALGAFALMAWGLYRAATGPLAG